MLLNCQFVKIHILIVEIGKFTKKKRINKAYKKMAYFPTQKFKCFVFKKKKSLITINSKCSVS